MSCRLWGCTSKGWKEISRPIIHGYDLNTLEAFSNLLISEGDEKILRVFETSKVTLNYGKEIVVLIFKLIKSRLYRY